MSLDCQQALGVPWSSPMGRLMNTVHMCGVGAGGCGGDGKRDTGQDQRAGVQRQFPDFERIHCTLNP